MQEENDTNKPPSELAAVVLALIDTLDDKHDEVQKSATESLFQLARKSPYTVIHTAVYYWDMHKKISESHLISLLNLMTEMIMKHGACLDDNLGSSVANLALAELTGHAEEQASDLFVALSRTQCSQAVGALIIKFEPDVIPHHSIIHSLGMIAARNYSDILPFVKVTLSVLVPLLPEMSEEQHKLASSYTLGKLGDAVLDCLTNAEIVSNTGCSKDMFFEDFSNAYEVLTYTWLRTTRNPRLIENILTSLVSILPLLPKSYDEKFIIKLTPALLNLCKRPNVRLPASKVLAIILNSVNKEDKEILRPYLDNIHQILSEIISTSPFEVSRDVLLTHYEVLHCFKAIVTLYPEEGLEKILQQMKSPSATHRAKALVVTRHLINTLTHEDDTLLLRIATALQDSLADGNNRQLVGAIVALAARQTFCLPSSQRTAFIKFMVLHCGSKSDESESCEEALFLLASTVEGAENWLWPALINALLDDTYVASATSILRALSPLSGKIIREENNVLPEKEFQSIKVLSRCLELLDVPKNQLAVLTFLKCSASLFGHQLKDLWDNCLPELIKIVDNFSEDSKGKSNTLLWEEKVCEFLEESVKSEGESWGVKLAEELCAKTISPEMSICISAVACNTNHITILIELARTHSVTSSGQSPTADEFSRAVGNCARRHLETVLKIMEEFCNIEDSRKTPVKLLGLVKDVKAAATAEAAKAGLLKAYAEIAKKGDPKNLFPKLEKNILPWIIRQINDCKELTTKECGLMALEQVGIAVHPKRFENSPGLKSRSSALATLLGLFQFSSGYRPIQLYPLILNAILSMLRIPPLLSIEEKAILLETTMDKVIASSPEMDNMKLTDVMQQVIECLGTISSEVVGDSADVLAALVDILLPWMQSKSISERRTTLLVLRKTLRSYYGALKYTYPGGKLEPGKLLGRFISWSADSEPSLRPLVIDCVVLALNISERHRSLMPDNNLNENLSESKRTIVNDDNKLLYDGVKNLATSVCERVPKGEIVNFAEGLIEGLLFRGEGGVAAGITLYELFKLRGSDIPRSSLNLLDSIISQLRQIDNTSCRKGVARAIMALSSHHPYESIEHILQQPLPLDNGTIECWKTLGTTPEIGSQILELLLNKLETDNVTAESNILDGGKRPTATFSTLAAIVAIGHLLNGPEAEEIISQQLPELFAVLLKYLAGWLHTDPPMSTMSTKFGFVPNRDTCKIIPHKEVYSVLIKVLNIIGIQGVHSLSLDLSESESDTGESLVITVQAVVKCLHKRSDVILKLAQILGKLVTSTISSQRAVAIALYTEILGKLKCDSVWLDALINTLHEAKSDSSPLVRKLATIGLTKIVCLEPKQIDDYFENSLSALLNGLEEPPSAEGSTEVVLESLRGLSILLSLKTKDPISPRIVLALKPFIEKENWEMRLAAINALGATALGWQRFALSPDDDVTDHLLGCLPCLAIKLEDTHPEVAMAAKNVLINSAPIMQCKSLSYVIKVHLEDKECYDVESFLQELISCLKTELPERAKELRNSVVQGYSRSENANIRSTSALILGLFGEPRPEDIQRLLQLLRDQESIVRTRAAHALSLCYINQIRCDN